MLRTIAELNPVLLLGGFAVVYLFGLLLRREWRTVLLSAWALLCLGMLVLPGGRQLQVSAQKLPDISGRAHCVSDALRAGALWQPAAVKETESCSYSGLPFRSR